MKVNIKEVLQLEESFLFLFGLFLYSRLDVAWWWFPAMLLVPDVSMIGYLLGPKIGAALYNFFHHRALAIVVYVMGFNFNVVWLSVAGLVLFSHASLDRVFGYGFKHITGFQTSYLTDIK